jgi:2-polyprenyl-3-methyl-5-hydroxy-6-metoxy-1,4-benzoquinol methylase
MFFHPVDQGVSNVDRAEIETRKRELEQAYGAWTSHNMQLHDDLYTIRAGVAGGNEARLRRVLQMAADLGDRPIDKMRVLDLGALEGLFAVEFARRGATVVAIEGREPNLEKLRLAKDALGLERLELRLEDARELRRERHGEFDLVLCLGLLYHLDAPDVFTLLTRMREVCRRLVVIDTRISSYPIDSYEHRGRRYWGLLANEPPADTPPHSLDALWSSLGNPRSFHLTRSSLFNALGDAQYSSVFECHLPPGAEENAARVTVAALTLGREQIMAVPELNDQPWARLAEGMLPLRIALRRYASYRWLEAHTPGRLKTVFWEGKRLLGRAKDRLNRVA